MNIAKKLAAGLLAALTLTSGLAACGADDDFNSESEFDNESLPASFNLFDEGRMTPARSQGGTGLCWAFGALSTVESAILTAGLAGSDELGLSAGAVAYFMYPMAGEFERGGKWHDLADEETVALFGKDYPIGNIGIKALLEA